jgi:hypothetical protein
VQRGVPAAGHLGDRTTPALDSSVDRAGNDRGAAATSWLTAARPLTGESSA